MICSYCEQEMAHGVGCTYHQFDGEPPRLPNLTEAKCHDCHCPQGTFHHPGCDAERCAVCGGQAISCDCHITVCFDCGGPHMACECLD
jgi:hypothetical protein